jgi:hypothetical protein
MRFYDRLGFQRQWEEFDLGILVRDGVELHLTRCADPRIAEHTTCRIEVQNLDDLFEALILLNLVHASEKIAVTPWGTREFGLLDPDGNLVLFYERY